MCLKLFPSVLIKQAFQIDFKAVSYGSTSFALCHVCFCCRKRQPRLPWLRTTMASAIFSAESDGHMARRTGQMETRRNGAMAGWLANHSYFCPRAESWSLSSFYSPQVCRKISALFVPNLLAAIATDLRRTGTKLSQSGGMTASIPARRYVLLCTVYFGGGCVIAVLELRCCFRLGS